MERFVCPPWYECPCISGKPVSRSTMLFHRKKANEKRTAMGLGLFAWGPKVPSSSQEFFLFDCHDSPAAHPSDNDGSGYLTLKGRCFYFDQAPRVSQFMESAHHGSSTEVVPTATDTTPDHHITEHQRRSGRFQNHNVYVENEDDDAVLSESLTSQPTSDQVACATEQQSSPSHSHITNDPERHSSSTCHDQLTFEQFDAVHQRTGDSSVELDPNYAVEAYGSSRIPELLPWMTKNQRWIELFYKHSLKETFIDEALEILGAPCRQWKTIMSNISQLSGLKEEMQTFATCPGHMAFASHQGELPDKCSVCQSPAPESLHADNSYTYFPIVPRLRRMVSQEQYCHELYEYRQSRISDPEVCRDFFDGAVYERICLRHGGESAVANDIFIVASTDGFSPFKNRAYDVWSIAAIIFNLPPHLRYMPQNVLPLAFVPGPHQPKDIQSYILPLVAELREATNRVAMAFPDGSMRNVRIHLIGFTGDQPAICKVSGLVGHNGRAPCRDCKIQGYYAGHYYFPTRIKETEDSSRVRVLFDPRHLPLRDVNGTRDSITIIENLTGAERRSMQTDLGIREGSVLFFLPDILPYSSFPHDIMHTFYNVQNEILRIMLGSYGDEFSIDRQLLTTLDDEFVSWKWSISRQLGPATRPLSKYRDWKAVEHKLFSISYSLVLFNGHLPRIYLDGLEMFSELVDICTRAEVTQDDIQRVRDVAIRFYEHFEKSYYRFRLDRVQFCKSVFHILLHLADCMERFGPLIGISQYWVEGYIGWVGQRNNSRIRPAQSMIKNALFGEALKLYYHRAPHEKASCVEELVENGGYLLLGSPQLSWLRKLPRSGRHIRKMLTDYLSRKYDISTASAKSLSSALSFVKCYARIRFLAGSDVQTAVVFHRESVKTRTRSSCYIAAEMQDDSCEASQVWFGRVLKIISFDLADFEANGEMIVGKRHDVVVMDWAQKLQKGRQGQIYASCSIKDVFTKPTAEDVCVVKRLVRVVEHRVPTIQASDTTASTCRRTTGRGTRSRTYFLDDAIRVDKLLTTNPSTDGVNRILKGFIS